MSRAGTLGNPTPYTFFGTFTGLRMMKAVFSAVLSASLGAGFGQPGLVGKTFQVADVGGACLGFGLFPHIRVGSIPITFSALLAQ